jgi:hypothetical protein
MLEGAAMRDPRRDAEHAIPKMPEECDDCGKALEHRLEKVASGDQAQLRVVVVGHRDKTLTSKGCGWWAGKP